MEGLIVYKEPVNPASEAYHTLCSNLLAGLDNKKIIEVVGVSESSNTSIITANLAVSMSQAGKKVLLVDCNLRMARQHIIFGFPNNGLTGCLSSVNNYNDFVQSTGQEKLFVLPAGNSVPNPIEVLLGQPMQELLNMAKEEYDIILLDMPPAGKVADAPALGSKTDGVILVFVNKKDKVKQAQKAKEIFNQAGVAILGCVLDKV